MADDEEYDDESEVDEWQAEAGKWKQKASEAERAAAENARAAVRLAELEKSTQGQADAHAEELQTVKAEADEIARAARDEGHKTAAEWRAEAEKWKQLSQKNEQLAKQNLAAAKRLEKLEAEKTETDAKTAETKAGLEAAKTAAELKAIRLAVAKDLAVPTALVDLLSGSSKKEIEQSADNLLRELAANKQPEPDTAKAAEAQQKAKEDGELAEARKLLAQAEIKALRLEVATEKQLPSGLADLLNGDSREALERQADALVAAIGGVKSAEQSTRSRMPVSRLRPGALPEGANQPDADPNAVADAIMRKARGY